MLRGPRDVGNGLDRDAIVVSLKGRTQSLLAQGGQRRPLQKFNRTRDIPRETAVRILLSISRDSGPIRLGVTAHA